MIRPLSLLKKRRKKRKKKTKKRKKQKTNGRHKNTLPTSSPQDVSS
jgi:hypothetical protein